ncbi:MAG: SCO family protein [Vulcanimicrobiota bacterium]
MQFLTPMKAMLVAMLLLFGELQIDASVPNFQLTNQNGKAVSMSDYKGKVVIVSFLFTQCPDPSKCPMLAGKLTKLQQLLSQMEDAQNKVQLLSITLDPKHDTPEVLKNYAQLHQAKDNWTFLTGSNGDINKIASLFGEIYYDEKGTVVHNTRTSLIDPHQRLRRVFTDNDWKMSEMAGAIRQLLDQ